MPISSSYGKSIRVYVNIVKFTAAAHLFVQYVGVCHRTEGPSMLPTLNVEGDWLLISHLHRRGRNIKVGDVVSFKHPLIPGEGAVKRVIGMPGDFVMRDSPGSGSDMMIQVPEGHCWVAGDNLAFSRDSRFYGPIPLALIVGKATARIWPFGERKWLRNGIQEAAS